MAPTRRASARLAGVALLLTLLLHGVRSDAQPRPAPLVTPHSDSAQGPYSSPSAQAKAGFAPTAPSPLKQAATPSASPPQDAVNDSPSGPTPPPGTSVVILVSLRSGAAEEITPWTHPADAARFRSIEEGLAAALAGGGYAVMATKEAMGMAAVRSVLRTAPRPLTPEAIAGVARAAGATFALAIQAEVIRSRNETGKKRVMSDVVINVRAYRAADGLRMASVQTRVSAMGQDEAEADADALGRAAHPLFVLLAAPLATAAGRPVIPPHPMPLRIEGRLGWKDYRRILDLLREEVPEIRSLEERRFSNGRFDLLTLCGCDPSDLAGRLTDMKSGEFTLQTQVEGEGVLIRATRTLGP